MDRNDTIPLELRQKYLADAYSKAAEINNDSLKTQYFSKLSLAYLQLPDSALFRAANRQALEFTEKINDSTALAEAHWDLAQFFNSYTIPDSAYYHYSEAHKLFSQLGDDFISARMLYNMAVIQGEVKDYTGSEINTIKAIELFKPLKKNLHLYLCYNNLGSITKELEEYDRALEYYSAAREYLDKVEEKNTLPYSLENNVGVVYQEMGRHRDAIVHFEQALSDSTLQAKNPRLYARALNNLAYSRHQLHIETDVSETYRKAVHILDSIEDWQGIARAHYNGAEYYKDLRDTAHALAHATTGHGLFPEEQEQQAPAGNHGTPGRTGPGSCRTSMPMHILNWTTACNGKNAPSAINLPASALKRMNLSPRTNSWPGSVSYG